MSNKKNAGKTQDSGLLDQGQANQLFEEWCSKKFFLPPEIGLENFELLKHYAFDELLLKALVEKRYEEIRTEPYYGNFEPESTYSDLWQIPTPEEKTFLEDTWESVREGSIQTGKCPTCNAKGVITCDACNGKGRIKTTVYEGGKSKNKYVDCNTCLGRGKLECPKCEGQKKVTTYTVGYVKWFVREGSAFSAPPPIPEKFYRQSEPEAILSDLSDIKELPKDVGGIAQNLIDTQIQEPNKEKLINKQLSLYRYYVDEVTYDYKNNKYSLFYYNSDKPFYAPKYPKNVKLGIYLGLALIESLFALLMVIGIFASLGS